MSNRSRIRLTGYSVLLLFCSFYWVLDSVWSRLSYESNLKYLIFTEPSSFLDTFLLHVSPYQAVSRLTVIALFFISGGLLLEFLIKLQTAKEESREAQHSLLTILDSIDAGIYVADMSTYEILFMNRHLQNLLGNDLTGSPCYQALRGEPAPCPFCPNEKLTDDRGEPTGVYTWEDHNPKTGKWYINHDRAIQWIDGRQVRIQISADITRLKKMEESLRQAQKMEALGALAGGIAHDFNNILTSIIGFSQLAMTEAEPQSKQYERLKEILDAGIRASDLVRQILTFARKTEMEAKPIQIRPLLKETIRFLRSTLPASIEIRSDITTDRYVLADPVQIHQVIVNLATNAADAMREAGGELCFGLCEKLVDPAYAAENNMAPGDYVLLTVRDTGPGIPEGMVEKIFDPYFSTKEKGKGTGLGLSATHGIIRDLGGKIRVQSRPREGTRFDVYFPAVRKKTEAKKPDGVKTLRGSERILLVDDEEPILKMCCQVLTRQGYVVTTEKSNERALELFRSNAGKFDLVLTDMSMPGMCGDDLAREILKIKPDTKIILVTGYSDRINTVRAKEIGIRALAKKPLIKDALVEIVRDVLYSDDSY